MRQLAILLIASLCIAAGISFVGCEKSSPVRARLLKIKIEPIPFKEDLSGLRNRKAIMDQKLVQGVQKYRDGTVETQEKPIGVTQAANQFVDNILYTDDEWAKIVKKAEESNFTMAEQICQNIEKNLVDRGYRVYFVKDDADITIDVTITKIMRGTDFSMLIADRVAYKGIRNNETIFSGEFNADTSIGIETPEQIGKLLAKQIAKDLKKAGLI